MGTATKIEWSDHTTSPWYGCQHATLPDGSSHPGCENCYAEAMAKRNPGTLGHWGDADSSAGTRVRSKSFLKNLRLWNKQCAERGVVETVFPSICDPFEDWQGPILDSKGSILDHGPHGTGGARVPPRVRMDWLRLEMFEAIDECPHLRFLLLTKRPGNVLRMWPAVAGFEYIPEAGLLNEYSMHRRENVALGTSISDQPTADALLGELAKLRDLCPVLFVSAEPLLGRVLLNFSDMGDVDDIDQVIVGCESNGQRVGRLGEFRSEGDWWDGARELRLQCEAAGVAFFMKQGPVSGRVSHDPAEWPEDMRVRQAPGPWAK